MTPPVLHHPARLIRCRYLAIKLGILNSTQNLTEERPRRKPHGNKVISFEQSRRVQFFAGESGEFFPAVVIMIKEPVAPQTV
jgi:hypothetical protein